MSDTARKQITDGLASVLEGAEALGHGDAIADAEAFASLPTEVQRALRQAVEAIGDDRLTTAERRHLAGRAGAALAAALLARIETLTAPKVDSTAFEVVAKWLHHAAPVVSFRFLAAVIDPKGAAFERANKARIAVAYVGDASKAPADTREALTKAYEIAMQEGRRIVGQVST